MKTKTYSLIIPIAIILASSMSYSQTIKEQSIQAITEFQESQDYTKLSRAYSAIGGDKSLPEEIRAQLYIRILIAANEYLDSHPKPEKTPTLNVAPPDGGISGVDPASIKDPVAREQYRKDIVENKDLIVARSRHNALSKLRDSIVTYCVSFSKMKPENEKIFSEFLKTVSSDPVTVKKVMALIEKEEANKTQQDNR